MRESPAIFALLLTLPQLAAAQVTEVPSWRHLFDSAGVSGTIVVYEPGSRQTPLRSSDARRAETRYLPASTFKVFNSLAALEAGVVSSPNQVIPWDGDDRCIDGWNRDLSLQEAYQASAFWVYQEFARRIGVQRMRASLEAAQYGNASLEGGIDRFWLDGGLRTSAVDQVRFLARLHDGDLPFSPGVMQTVREVMIEEHGDGYVLRGKTGWARQLTRSGDRFADCRPETGASPGTPVGQEVGWYVGYVEWQSRVVYFALNIDVTRPEDAAARRALVRRVLQHEGWP